MEEECKYGLTSGTCFTARRLEVVAVAGLLWIYFVFFFRYFYFERTRRTASTKQPCLMYLSTSTGVRTGCHRFVCLSVRLSACVFVTFVVLMIARVVQGRFPQTRDLWKRASMG